MSQGSYKEMGAPDVLATTAGILCYANHLSMLKIATLNGDTRAPMEKFFYILF